MSKSESDHSISSKNDSSQPVIGESAFTSALQQETSTTKGSTFDMVPIWHKTAFRDQADSSTTTELQPSAVVDRVLSTRRLRPDTDIKKSEELKKVGAAAYNNYTTPIWGIAAPPPLMNFDGRDYLGEAMTQSAARNDQTAWTVTDSAPLVPGPPKSRRMNNNRVEIVGDAHTGSTDAEERQEDASTRSNQPKKLWSTWTALTGDPNPNL